MRTLLSSLHDHAMQGLRYDEDEPADVGGDPDRVTRILYREDRRINRGREGGRLIHASACATMPPCARAYRLLYEMKKAGATFEEPIFGSMRLVWAFGRAAEKHVRETLLRDSDMRADAYGLWRCRCGSLTVRGHLPPKPDRCKACNSQPTRYAEIALFDKTRALVGNPDFIFKDGDRYRIVEIKSIAGQTKSSAPDFASLDGPLPNHVMQAVHYVKLARSNRLRVHRRPLLLYVSKSFEIKGWYKAFIPNDAQIKRAEDEVDMHRRITREYEQSVIAGPLPEMIPQCVESSSARQKSCPAWAECMARRNAANASGE